MKPSDFQPGDGVVFRSRVGPPEDGVVTSVNEHYVFVRFRSQHPGADGQACNPQDLCLHRKAP